MLSFFLDLIFPPRCIACLAYLQAGALCDKCREAIPLNQTFFCGACGARRPQASKVCHQDQPYILAAAGEYEAPALQALIRALKFQGVRVAAEPLAELLVRYAKRLPLTPHPETLVVPVPLSVRRERERGFNQAALLAKPLARAFRLTYAPRILRRVRHTAPQSKLRAHEDRARNVAGCFAVAPDISLKGKRVWLVDDVTTSGNTLGEAARALRSAGARGIIAWTVAKA